MTLTHNTIKMENIKIKTLKELIKSVMHINYNLCESKHVFLISLGVCFNLLWCWTCS